MRISEIKSYGKGLNQKEKQRIGYDPDLLAYRHKVKDIYPIKDWQIMPQTIEPQGLIHLPGKGPNNRFDFKNKGNNRVNEAVQFTKPDTQYEWSEAQRYSYIKKLGFLGWNKLVNTGRQVNVSQFGGIRKIKNTTALNQPMAARELPKLEPDKVQRAEQSLKMGKFELPIVMKTPQGTLELVAGNTRFTMMVAKGITPTVWYIDGSALREWTAFEMACMEGGHPLPEDAAGVGTITKQNTTKDVKPGDEYKNVKKLHLEWQQFKENTGIDWNTLRTAGVVQPMLYDVPNNPVRPTAQQPNIITAVNLTQKLGPGEKLTPLNDKAVTPEFWQKYMDDWWTKNKNDPAAKNKIDQIKQSARMKGVQFNENFADKKVKGKSRPGRVKRAGASCKGSVSSLRSKAKKYSGERGKMYHWCANMKSGRK